MKPVTALLTAPRLHQEHQCHVVAVFGSRLCGDVSLLQLTVT